MAAETAAIISIRDDQPTPMNVIQLAISQGADVDRLTKLFELITKNKHVQFGQTKYDHATLDRIRKVIAEGRAIAAGIRDLQRGAK